MQEEACLIMLQGPSCSTFTINIIVHVVIFRASTCMHVTVTHSESKIYYQCRLATLIIEQP